MPTPQLQVGGRALVGSRHKFHPNKTVTLLSYGPYGLHILNLVGWHCRADDSLEFYAKTSDLTPL